MIQVLNSIEQFSTVLSLSTSYDLYNLSIGSKYNTNDTPFSSNAQLQMIPNFLNRLKKILIIVVDIFNEIDLIKNISILKNTVDTNINVVLLNHSFTEDILLLFLKYVEINKIIPNNCMIINYIKFLSPNDIEVYTEQNVYTIIRNVLKEQFNGKYKNIFYQWFGYSEIFYNLIYNDSMYLLHSHAFVHSWFSVQSNRPLNYYELHFFKHKILNLSHSQKQKINNCLQYCIDIQSYTINETDYFTPLLQFL
jgi:hypothetical protein